MTTVFLSYARDDDEPFVRRLFEDLTAHGFKVWYDRESLMSRGLTFHQEIRDAIRVEVDRLIYIIGPKAVVSPYVREEMLSALEHDKLVIPILRRGEYDSVPGELRLLHCDDFRDDSHYIEQLSKLAGNLERPQPPLGKLYAVPALPVHFLGRDEVIRRVKDALLVDLQCPDDVSSRSLRVGLQGMGGIGKSVLAAVVARNREVRLAYPDGVIWITFGRQPDLVQLQRDIARHLGGQESFETEVQGQGILKQLLLNKAAFLILDDVWEARHARSFDFLGPRCRALITTRDAGILHTLQGELLSVALFTEEESLRLLAESVNVEPASLPGEAAQIVRECGYLPLAVALSGGMARSGAPWGSILQRLQRADLDRISDRQAINEQHRSIWCAMQASVDALTDDDDPCPDKQRRFAELSVFPVDQSVPAAAVATLWEHTGNLSSLDTEDLLRNLSERSLIRTDKEPLHPEILRISMHDLLYDYASRIAGQSEVLHNTLLSAYRAKYRLDKWSAGPDDGYYLQYLPVHLAEAGWWEDLMTVIQNHQMAYLSRWIEQGEGAIALVCLPKLVDHLVEMDRNSVFAAGLCTQIARLHTARGNHDQSEQYLNRTLEYTSPEHGRRERAIALHELGSHRLYHGDKSSARSLYCEALTLCIQGEPVYDDEAAANLVALATIAIEEHDYKRAVRISHRALRRARLGLDFRHTVAAQILLARASKDCARWEEADKYIIGAKMLVELASLRLERVSLGLLQGWLDYTRSVLEGLPMAKAIGCFQEALRDALQSQHLSYAIEARLGLAWCSLAECDTEQAVRWLEESSAFSVEESYRGLAAVILVGKAAVSHQRRLFPEAQQRYQAAIDFTSRHAQTSAEADAWVGRGAVHWQLDEFTDALNCWEKAKEISSRCSPIRQRLVALSIKQSQAHPEFTPR